MTDERPRISEAALIEVLIHELGSILGRDANFVGERIRIYPHQGSPNWRAQIGPAGTLVKRAFVMAVERVKSRYDLE